MTSPERPTRSAFDGDAFYAALDAERASRGLTWRKVSIEAGVSASTLTRMSQGKRPDVDSLSLLCRWAGLDADDYMRGREAASDQVDASNLAKITTYLRSDPHLSPEGAKALEQMIKAAYENFDTR